MDELRPGQNPREVFGRRHRERGPKVYGYTRADLAALVGIKKTSVPRDMGLAEVVAWANRRLQALQEKPSEGELAEAFGERNWGLWQSRYPRLDAWLCRGTAEPRSRAKPRNDGRCDEILLSPGLCRFHGGGKPAMRLAGDFYPELWTAGGYVPLHRILMGEPEGMDVHHIDLNKFNNRHANLRVLTHEDHMRLHGDLLRRP